VPLEFRAPLNDNPATALGAGTAQRSVDPTAAIPATPSPRSAPAGATPSTPLQAPPSTPQQDTSPSIAAAARPINVGDTSRLAATAPDLPLQRTTTRREPTPPLQRQPTNAASPPVSSAGDPAQATSRGDAGRPLPARVVPAGDAAPLPPEFELRTAAQRLAEPSVGTENPISRAVAEQAAPHRDVDLPLAAPAGGNAVVDTTARGTGSTLAAPPVIARTTDAPTPSAPDTRLAFATPSTGINRQAETVERALPFVRGTSPAGQQPSSGLRPGAVAAPGAAGPVVRRVIASDSATGVLPATPLVLSSESQLTLDGTGMSTMPGGDPVGASQSSAVNAPLVSRRADRAQVRAVSSATAGSPGSQHPAEMPLVERVLQRASDSTETTHEAVASVQEQSTGTATDTPDVALDDAEIDRITERIWQSIRRRLRIERERSRGSV